MTIDELLALANLTANDEIPVWDAEATGEPTKKITAQQLAASIVALANLVTGVKGNAESTYRNGNVNLTPENIEAVNSKTGATRRIVSGSVNDAPLGMTSYNGNDNLTQRPYSFWFDVFMFKSAESNYARQVAIPWSNNRSIAFRIQDSGTWSSWRYIATQTTEPTA